ncbi:MAG: hypothetical protein JXB38_20485 [Anaerolineales bacterium]|nr:hypothetical protein [Anaerolineales bacterium]
MNVKQVKTFVALVTILAVLAAFAGSWSPGQSAGLPQVTIPTSEPTHTPDPTATATGVPFRPPVYTGPIPLIFIVDVIRDDTVTIRTVNFPKNVEFAVLMNYYGTLGIAGLQVDTVNSGAGGELRWTFKIPDSLKGLQRIAIRLVSYSTGYYAYNWFWNFSTIAGPAAPTPAATIAPGTPGTTLPPFVIPTFFIQAVQKDTSVTIVTNNFPANDTFDVYMNFYGTAGINGIKIGSVDSGAGGVLTYTLTIPDAMKGQPRIAVRLKSPTSGYYAFNWFWNNTYP